MQEYWLVLACTAGGYMLSMQFPLSPRCNSNETLSTKQPRRNLSARISHALPAFAEIWCVSAPWVLGPQNTRND